MKQVLLGWLFVILASDVLAHRLDEYLQATRILVASNRVDLSIDLTPGVAVADQVLALIDKDCDGRISNAEGTAYAQRVLKDLELRLDEKVLDLGSMNVVFPSLQDVKNGLGVIRIKASAALGQLAAGRHKLKLTNTHLPTISVYLVNALVPQDPAIKLARQTRDELQRDYRLEFSMGTSSP